MTQAAIAFKYTFPIAKAEQRSDGAYIVGYASGPEVDTEGERMTPEAIERFSAQINDAPDGEKLVYRDAHAPDGVLRDLGDITKAWVNEHFHLGIEVKLDMENPAAAFLFRSVLKGKQYGMSVAGRVIDYADEYLADAATVVRTYKNVALDEISNTTRPAWYPSFGTVLSKSIKDAASTASTGVTVDKNELLDAVVEEATKSEAVPADDITKASDAAMDAADATYVLSSLLRLLGDETDEPKDAALLRTAIAAVQEYIAMETAEIGTPEDVATTAEHANVMMSETPTNDDASAVEKAKLSGVTSAKLLGLYNTMAAELIDLGVIEAPAATEEIVTESEKSASDAEEDTVEKTDATEATADVVEKSETDDLATELKKANERIAALEARPATALPGLVTDETKKAAGDELADLIAKASPSDRVRLAFAAYTGGK